MTTEYKAVTLEEMEESFNKLDPREQQVLQQLAKPLMQNPLFRWLTEEMTRVAQRKMFKDSTDLETFNFGKACLYIVEVQNKKLVNLSKMK